MGDARLALRFVAGLPFERWAVRLSTGQADIRGTISAVEVLAGGNALSLHAGPAHLELLFIGGPRPRLAAVVLTASGSHNGAPFASLRLVQGEVVLDDAPLPHTGLPLASGELVTTLLDHLSDLQITARARPAACATVRLPEGIEVTLSDREEIEVRACTAGCPSDVMLAGPLHLHFGDDGVHIEHKNARWLARIARVRIRGAHLHPDGRVVLEGGGPRGLDRLIRGGLRTASAQLTVLVRSSPRFSQVRDFLRR